MHNYNALIYNKKIVKLLLSFFIVSTLFLSAFIVHNQEHECTGDDCYICATLQIATHVVKDICSANKLELYLSLFISFFFIPKFTFWLLLKETLVSQKVQLND